MVGWTVVRPNARGIPEFPISVTSNHSFAPDFFALIVFVLYVA
jgi:hypothetical protein